MKKNKDKDKTKYGEFVPTYFSWISPEFQKERAKEMNNMTKKSKH